jgi:hypothetical protein
MNAPQIIILVLLSLQFIANVVFDGRARPNFNAAIAFIELVVITLILRWGGFFP